MSASKLLCYKNYYGSFDIDAGNNLLFGKIEFIRALVTYEAKDAASLEQAFHEAVDDYLEFCYQNHIEPERPFKGSLNVRIGKERHQKASLAARALNQSLNEYLCHALDEHFNKDKTPLKQIKRSSKRAATSLPPDEKRKMA